MMSPSPREGEVEYRGRGSSRFMLPLKEHNSAANGPPWYDGRSTVWSTPSRRDISEGVGTGDDGHRHSSLIQSEEKQDQDEKECGDEGCGAGGDDQRTAPLPAITKPSERTAPKDRPWPDFESLRYGERFASFFLLDEMTVEYQRCSFLA